MGTNDCSILIENLTKTYSMGKVEVTALRGVNLCVQQGEMIAIIGASGSGKSTLMNIIGCLDKPTSGKYIFNGQDVSRLNDNKLAEMRSKSFGFVFQDFNLLRRSTAIANVELPMIYSGNRQRHKRALEALERVGLAKRANHKPTELSGGEQQRVAIARALIKNPAIVLADEPTGNLDSKAGESIMSILMTLQSRGGITLVMITHDRHIATHCKRIVHIKDGLIEGEETV